MLALGAIRLHRGAVGAQQIVRRDRRFEQIAMTRRQRAVQVAAVGDDPRLVERHPLLHAVIELAEHNRCVVGEPLRRYRD